MSEVTHGESKALVISEISDITKLDSLNRESYKIICYGKQHEFGFGIVRFEVWFVQLLNINAKWVFKPVH